MIGKFRVLAMAGALLLAGIGAAGIAPGANASQGGCRTFTPSGHSIGICIDDHNTGTNGYADYYVNNALPGNCRIQVEIWDSNGPQRWGAWQDNNSCARGHHFNNAWCVTFVGPAGNLEVVHAFFRLFINGKQVNDLSTNSKTIGLKYSLFNHC
ncbi:MAG TPA: hypothetical protein VF070_44725 [Streptosporangiaceae bacterium]